MDDRQAQQLIMTLDEVRTAIDRLREEAVNIAIAFGAFADVTKDLAKDVAESDDDETTA